MKVFSENDYLGLANDSRLKAAAKDAIERLTERVDADLVQVIGRNGLLFKRNFKKPVIEFPEQ